MNYFDKYVLNTLTVSSIQAIFLVGDEHRIYTRREFYKISAEGKYNYSFLFSNIIDNTFRTRLHKNFACGSFA